MPNHGFHRWMLVGVLAFTAARNMSSGAEDRNRPAPPVRTDWIGSPEVDGMWTTPACGVTMPFPLLLKDGRVLIGGGRTYSGIREDANAQGVPSVATSVRIVGQR